MNHAPFPYERKSKVTSKIPGFSLDVAPLLWWSVEDLQDGSMKTGVPRPLSSDRASNMNYSGRVVATHSSALKVSPMNVLTNHKRCSRHAIKSYESEFRESKNRSQPLGLTQSVHRLDFSSYFDRNLQQNVPRIAARFAKPQPVLGLGV